MFWRQRERKRERERETVNSVYSLGVREMGKSSPPPCLPPFLLPPRSPPPPAFDVHLLPVAGGRGGREVGRGGDKAGGVGWGGGINGQFRRHVYPNFGNTTNTEWLERGPMDLYPFASLVFRHCLDIFFSHLDLNYNQLTFLAVI